VLYGFDEASLAAFKNHEVINAFINGRDKALIWIFFPLIMISEELIFRLYLISFLLNEIRLDLISAILVSSLIFSLYHVYMWFKYKNKRVFIIYFGSSFLLGLFNGFILLTLGVIICVLIHYFLVIDLYYSIFKRNFKKNRS
jgi:membrane protease YdiL (CAAX protease family)